MGGVGFFERLGGRVKRRRRTEGREAREGGRRENERGWTLNHLRGRSQSPARRAACKNCVKLFINMALARYLRNFCPLIPCQVCNGMLCVCVRKAGTNRAKHA